MYLEFSDNKYSNLLLYFAGLVSQIQGVVNFYKEKKLLLPLIGRNILSACLVSQVSSGNYPKASLSQCALDFFRQLLLYKPVL